MYLTEMAPASRPGRMVTVDELMITSGQLLAFVLNAVLNATIDSDEVWRYMLGVAAVPAIALFIGTWDRVGSTHRHSPRPRRTSTPSSTPPSVAATLWDRSAAMTK